MMKDNNFLIMMQGFYGNRTVMEVKENEIDYLLQGILDKSVCRLDYEPDRTMVKIPESQCVLVYNKYLEEAALKKNKDAFEECGYVAKPVAVISDIELKIYSRCFICRVTSEGDLMSVEDEDMEIVSKYLAL